MHPQFWRITAALVVVLFFVAKFFVFGPLVQISQAEITERTTALLTEATHAPMTSTRQRERADLQQFIFSLPDCPAPYIALQSMLMEDPQSVIDAAGLPPGLEPHVIYLGDELGFADRFSIRMTTITKFIAYRLGLSPERPTNHLYIVMAAPGCAGYRSLPWWKAWAT